MNRRSFLSFLGIAPVAAPAAVAAASAPPIDYGLLVIDARERVERSFVFDGQTLTVPGIQVRHASLPEGKMTLRASADSALAEKIDAVIARVR